MTENWHGEHRASLSLGDRVADAVASGMGSWTFIIVQTAFVAAWMIANVIGWLRHWDPYPFILLNLLFSTQAAYAAPIIMMSQNRQSDRDRYQAQVDFDTNLKSEREVEQIQTTLSRLETDKLDRILRLLEEEKAARGQGHAKQ